MSQFPQAHFAWINNQGYTKFSAHNMHGLSKKTVSWNINIHIYLMTLMNHTHFDPVTGLKGCQMFPIQNDGRYEGIRGSSSQGFQENAMLRCSLLTSAAYHSVQLEMPHTLNQRGPVLSLSFILFLFFQFGFLTSTHNHTHTHSLAGVHLALEPLFPVTEWQTIHKWNLEETAHPWFLSTKYGIQRIAVSGNTILQP